MADPAETWNVPLLGIVPGKITVSHGCSASKHQTCSSHPEKLHQLTNPMILRLMSGSCIRIDFGGSIHCAASHLSGDRACSEARGWSLAREQAQDCWPPKSPSLQRGCYHTSPIRRDRLQEALAQKPTQCRESCCLL